MPAWLDLAAGASFLAVAVAAWRHSRRYAVLAVLAGAAWYAGGLSAPLLLLHRPLMVHAALAYPDGRVAGWYRRFVLAVFWLGALVPAVGVRPWFMLAQAALLAVGLIRRRADRAWSAVTAARATAALALSLAVPAALRAWWPGAAGPDLLIAIYSSLVLAAGLVLPAGLARPAGRTADAVIELSDGTPEQTLADLRREAERTREPVERAALTSAATLLAANAALQAELAARVDEVRASRDRLVEAAASEQRRLERQLRVGALAYLDQIDGVLRAVHDGGTETARERAEACLDEVARARDDLSQLARGLHPRTLSEHGLAAALAELVSRGPAPTTMRAPPGRLPAAVEAALWYACAEALANVAKHAGASAASVEVRAGPGEVIATIRDDGVGGAHVTPTGGLAGLADRLAAVGGRVAVRPIRAGGTEVQVRVPLP